MGRQFTDIDFASYPRYLKDISRLLTELGYKEDKTVTQLFSDSRTLFHDLSWGRHIDIFFNKVDFCHPVVFTGRLEVEELTLPLAELLLEKMQIVKINEIDLIDTIMLLREHSIGMSDDQTINCQVVCGLLANDWAFWRTVTGNLLIVEEFLERYKQLTDDDRQVVRERLHEIQVRIDATPKTSRWKLRSRVGERLKWYKDVEELAHR